jgi:hypothetical protein
MLGVRRFSGRTPQPKGHSIVKAYRTGPLALTVLALAVSAAAPLARAQSENTGVPAADQQKLALTPAQRNAIYAAVSQDKSKQAPKQFAPVLGADVPPMIELYPLPENAVADTPAAKFYQYTVVSDRVVLVDPTRMQVIAVIGPPQQ